MPLFEAPSISIISSEFVLVISLHEIHLLQGVGVGPFSQFRAFARILAVVVLPIPLGPQKRYAWATLSCFIAFLRVVVICSWPITSSNVCGRHFLASTIYDIVFLWRRGRDLNPGSRFPRTIA